MRERICLIVVFGLGIALGAYLAQPRQISAAKPPVAVTSDTRDSDREAIRAHIDSIFRAYINGDCKTIRATHSANWVGFTGQSRSIMRGIDTYMNNSAAFCAAATPARPSGALVDYKLAEIDYEFYGDVALVPYVAETWYGQARNPGKLRSLDVYAKVNGEWTQVGSNIYLHPDMIQAQFQRAEQPGQLSPDQQKSLMTAREAVWRAFFAGDQPQLEKLVPEEAFAIAGGPAGVIDKRADILASSKQFGTSGTKLVGLEFPRTEMQVYGNTVILYTTYHLEFEDAAGKRETSNGRGTEIFVNRQGAWVNTGWSLQSDK